eukprot:5000196-Pyramimonas_sp.AAC.1
MEGQRYTKQLRHWDQYLMDRMCDRSTCSQLYHTVAALGFTTAGTAPRGSPSTTSSCDCEVSEQMVVSGKVVDPE